MAHSFAGFPSVTFDFLAGVAENNDAVWFKAHQAEYRAGFVEPARAFVEAVGERMRRVQPDLQADPRVNGSIFRLNRDTRFSADKTPYKTHLDLMFWIGTGRSRECAALFFRMFPDSVHLGGGMHGFDRPTLAAFQQAIVGPAGEELESIVAGLGGYEVGGEGYKKVPRGLDADHPRARWLKNKALFAGRTLSPLPEEMRGPGCVDFVAAHFERLLPLTQWVVSVVEGAKGA